MTESVFERHPKKTLCCVVFVVLTFFALAAEVYLRFTIPYDIAYYTAIKKKGVYSYPYGDITINSEGFPDKEFNLNGTKPRIGYLGDSIIMGIGAGDDYRFSDLLEKNYPAYDHWTFALMGNGLNEKHLYKTVDKYGLQTVVYGLNLNDFLPMTGYNGEPIAGDNQSFSEKIIQTGVFIAHNSFDWFRGKSYLYTSLRTGVKNLLTMAGYGHTGLKSIEFFPSKNGAIIRELAFRIGAVSQKLHEQGVTFCLVIFPYEMQISEQAAKTYSNLGISWEEGFTRGLTQEIFLQNLSIPYVYDGRNAFEESDLDTAAGTYFVYNRGDKVDFNHPNREGHARLTRSFETSKACPFLKN